MPWVVEVVLGLVAAWLERDVSRHARCVEEAISRIVWRSVGQRDGS